MTQTADDLPYSEAPSAQPGLNVEELLFALWLIGVCMLLLWFAAVNIRLWRKLRHSRRMVSIENFPLKVYITDEAETPCLFGLLRPAVYLTLETPLEGPALRHVLEHELAHRRQGDHIWALLRGLCLVLHWYNPLVWWAASLSKRDAELACDEAAVRRLGEGERADYGRTLLGLSCGGRPDLLRAATTMTGGKRALRERIRMLAKRPHTAHYALVLLLLAAGRWRAVPLRARRRQRLGRLTRWMSLWEMSLRQRLRTGKRPGWSFGTAIIWRRNRSTRASSSST